MSSVPRRNYVVTTSIVFGTRHSETCWYMVWKFFLKHWIICWKCSGVARKFFRGEQMQRVFPSPSLPFSPSSPFSLPSPLPLALPPLFSLPLPSPLPLPFHLPPIRSRTPKSSYGVWGSSVSFPSGFGRSPSPNRTWCIIALKYKIWWQQEIIVTSHQYSQTSILRTRLYRITQSAAEPPFLERWFSGWLGYSFPPSP